MFESKNKYFGRKKGKSFPRLKHLQEKLIPPSLNTFKKINNPRVLEIGIGDGEKITVDAKNHTKINFIGCDIFADGVLRVIRNSINHNLENLLVFHMNVQDILPHIPKNYLQGIRVYFPDPWPKKKHKKRRTFNRDLVGVLTSKLKKNGYINFATDNSDYFLDALVLMSEFNYSINNIGPDSWRYNDFNALNTKFEKKALDKNHKLFYFNVLKNY